MSDALDVLVQCLRKHYREDCLPDSLYPPEAYNPEALTIHQQYYPNDIGVCTSIQRHNDALSLYPHFHVLSTDGLFTSTHLNPNLTEINHQQSLYKARRKGSSKPVQFIPYSVLTTEKLGEVLVYFRYRLIKRFIKRGYLRPTEENQFILYWGDQSPDEELEHLLHCFSASLGFRKAFGWEAGQHLCFDWDEQPELTIKSDLCVELEGFGLHAATHIQASDREGLEQLCRYIHRPPLASERLKLMEDGKIYYQFKNIPILNKIPGVKNKIALPRWFRYGYIVLRKMKFLRGTRFDFMSWFSSDVRQSDREILHHYKTTLINNIDKISNGGYADLVKFSELPDLIRGYEEVRLSTVETYYKEANNLFKS